MVFRMIHSTEKRVGKWCLELLIRQRRGLGNGV